MLNRLTKNWVLKLLSLVFSLVLWFFVMGEQKLELGYTVPLELKNVPTGLMVANDVPSLVNIRISGPRTVLANLRPSDISIVVDLGDLQPGLTSFKRLEERLNIPSVLKVTRLSPSYIDVKLERIKEKTVPVRVTLAGSLPDGYSLGEVGVKPNRIVLKGAEGELKDLSEVVTDPVDVADVRESFSLMVPVNYQGKFTSVKDVQSVEVRVEVSKPPRPIPPTVIVPELPKPPSQGKEQKKVKK